MRFKWLVGAVMAVGLLGGATAAAQSTPETTEKAVTELRSLPGVLGDVSAPDIKIPKWLTKIQQERAARSQTPTPAGPRVVTYTVGTKGSTSSSFSQFAAQANQTLNDSRGWAQLDIQFRQVQTRGSFHLILSQASQVPSFSPGCSADWSCRVGASVIINDDRWSGATTAWNNAGGGLRDYRHMVINHEVGHWLGHGHPSGCSPSGSLAPVMLQQSIDLRGCKFNPWPLDSELQATR